MRYEYDEYVYVWNAVTKRRFCVKFRDAGAEIRKQKYPQNWEIVDLRSCSNCGGEYDAEQNCNNYCLKTMPFREEPKPEPTYLGKATSWSQVFDTVRDMHYDQTIESVIIVSNGDLPKMQPSAAMIDNYKIGDQLVPAREAIKQMHRECVSKHSMETRFRLFTKDILVEGLSRRHRAYTQLVVVYLKPGEQFVLPAPEKIAATITL